MQCPTKARGRLCAIRTRWKPSRVRLKTMPTRCIASGMHTEKGSTFRKSVLESETYERNHGRFEGALHVCTRALPWKSCGSSSRQWLVHFLRDIHISGKDRAAHELRCLCDVLEEAACFDQLNLEALACLEVAARRLNLMVDADKKGDAPSYVNAKCLTLAETDEILAPGLRAQMSRRAREDWKWCKAPEKLTQPRR